MAQSHTAKLFTLSESGNIGETGRAQAAVSGVLTATGSLHRGIDLSAGLDLSANVSAEVRDGVAASVSAGAGARVGGSLRAVFPIDLFDRAGIIAGLRLQAEASAFVRATIGLEMELFRDLVRQQVAAPWSELLEIFFEETTVEAGMWGRASFSAQLMAEATVVGNFLTLSDGTPPGITCSARAAAGFGFGAGYDFVANLGFEDPRRLLTRLGDRTLSMLDRSLQAIVEDLPDDRAEAGRLALTLTRFVFPLALRGAIDAGIELAQATPESVSSGSAGDRTATAIVDAFVREAQAYVLQALFDLGAGRLRAALQADVLESAIEALPDEARTEVTQALRELDSALGSIESAASHPSLDAWLSAVVALLEPAERFIQAVGLSDDEREPLEEATALLWSAAVLLKHCLARPPGQWLGSNLAESRDGSAIAARVATSIAKPAGSGLTLLDLVRYLLETDPVQELTEALPEAGPVVEWLQEALAGGGQDLLQRLFQGLAPGDTVAAEGLLPDLAEAFSEAFQQRILPDLLQPITEADPEMGRVIEEVVAPCVRALAELVVARIGNLQDLDDVRRLREQFSAVLLNFISRFVLSSFNVLLRRALDDAGDSMRQAGDEVAALAGGSPVFGVAMAASSVGLLGTAILPDDVRDVMYLTADAIDHWSATQREPLFELIEVLIGLGLATGDATVDATWTRLAESDHPLLENRVRSLLERLVLGAADLIVFVVPRAALIWAMHWVRLGQEILELVEEGAKAAIEAIESAANWLAQTIEQLKAKAEQLLRDIASFVANISAEIARIAQRLQQLVTTIVDEIREAGWALVALAIPGDLTWLEDAFRGAYDAVFDAIKWLLNAPLALLGSIATWVHQELSKQIAGGATNTGAITSAVSGRVNASYAASLSFPVRIDTFLGPIDLGTISLPGGSILTTLVGVVFGDQTVQSAVGKLSATGANLARAQNELATTQAAIQGHLTQQTAQTAAANLVTGRPLAASIQRPMEARGYSGQAGLRLIVDGANLTYVDSVAGVPPRVRVRVNGADYPYAASGWRADGTTIVFDAIVVPSPVGLVPTPLRPAFDLIPMDLPAGATLVVIEDEAGDRIRIEIGDVGVEIAPMTAAPEEIEPMGKPVIGSLGAPLEAPSEPVGPGAGTELASLEVASGGVIGRIAVRTASPPVVALPESGPVLETSEGGRQVMVAARHPGLAPTAADIGAGYQLVPTIELEEVIIGPAITGVVGLNTVELLVADGKGARQHVVRSFYLS